MDASGRGFSSGYGAMLRTCNASSSTQKIRAMPIDKSTTRWVTIMSETTRLCLTLEGMNGPNVIWDGCGTGENGVFELGGDPGGGTICTAGSDLKAGEQGSELRCLSASMSSDPSGAAGVPTGIGLQMWAKPQADGAIAVLVLNNRNPTATNVSVDIEMSEITQVWRTPIEESSFPTQESSFPIEESSSIHKI